MNAIYNVASKKKHEINTIYHFIDASTPERGLFKLLSMVELTEATTIFDENWLAIAIFWLSFIQKHTTFQYVARIFSTQYPLGGS